MYESRKTPAIVLGFAEGFLAPVIELVAGIMIGAFLLVSSSIGAATGIPSLSNYTSLIFTTIACVDILRNIFASLMHAQFAIGNVVGNVFGLLIFYGAIRVISPESANSSIFWTIVMLLSLIIGICLTFWKTRSEQNDYY